MYKFVLKRLLQLIPVIIGVTFIVFFIMNLAPGDPAAIILGDQATAEALAMKREELGLNDPLLVRYFNYMKNLLRGDMGTSYKNNIPVWNQVIDRLPNTAILAVAGIFIAKRVRFSALAFLVISIHYRPISIVAVHESYPEITVIDIEPAS